MSIDLLIYIVIIALILGVVAYAAQRLLPQPWQNIALFLLVIIFLIVLLNVLGVMPRLGARPG